MGNKGSLTLMRIHGIPVRLHFTFLIILPYLAWVIARTVPMLAHLAGIRPTELTIYPLIMGAILAVSLFVCVLLHEFAHVLVGVRAGAKVEGVTLMIVGGVSEISEFPSRPIQEAAMAAAGPLASFFIAVFSYVCFGALGSALPDLRFGLYYLAYMNLALAIFNLLPAFPMDGGRILRALLAMLMNRVRATHVASLVGQGVAVVLLAAGLFSLNWVLILIGVLVVAGARAEYEMVKSSSVLAGLTVGQAMQRFPPTVDANDSLNLVLDRMRQELKTIFFVVSGGELLGLISSQDLPRLDSRLSPAQAKDAMRNDFPRLTPGQNLATAARLLRSSGYDLLPVLDGQTLLGDISMATIAHALRVREANHDSSRVRQTT